MNERERILVVDDDVDAGQAVAGVLSDAGYDVETARSGAEALNKLRAGVHDLVLSDVRMPDLDGLELIRRVHELDPHRPVLLMTAVTTGDLLTAAQAYGAAGCLAKPVEAEQLVWRIELILACLQQSSASSPAPS